MIIAGIIATWLALFILGRLKGWHPLAFYGSALISAAAWSVLWANLQVRP